MNGKVQKMGGREIENPIINVEGFFQEGDVMARRLSDETKKKNGYRRRKRLYTVHYNK